ncbi:MAG: hypothetical protein WD342_20205 [Verrucomicrobiales bacterium]
MNRDEARFLLSGVSADRLDGLDRSDPQIRDALEFVANDPELRSWFEASSRFDGTISDRLAEVEPPPGLRDSIVAGMRASHSPPGRGRRMFLAAVAAVLTAGVILTAFLNRGGLDSTEGNGPTFVEFEADMLEAITGLDALDHRSADPKDILSWLRRQGIEGTPEFVSAETANVDGERNFVGCKILDWEGYRVSLICLRRGGNRKGMPDLHFLTIPAEAIQGLAPDELIAHLPGRDASFRQWSTAIWRSDDLVHLVVAEGNHPDPRSLVPFG